MRALARAIWIAVCLLCLAISVPVVLSGNLRFAYATTMLRKLAWLWPQDYAFIGDSLTLNCTWRWVTGRPLSTVMTYDGIHFTHQSCTIWNEAIEAQIARMPAK